MRQQKADQAVERLVRTVGGHIIIAAEQGDAKVGNFHPVAPNPLAPQRQLRQNSSVRSDGASRSTSTGGWRRRRWTRRSAEETSELQSLMRISYAVFCLNKNK